MARRPLLIALSSIIVILAALVAEAVHHRLYVEPLPECAIRRNCPTPDPVPLAPLVAPLTSDIRLPRRDDAHQRSQKTGSSERR
jgi:hypothetical protein